ncbi:MAG: hypothetical protein QOD26_2528 [Betaproteobacteria bacterium]|jgi:hypothetical protein|nr:hypothetical protein [Betaproteobacteria bacterium]
MHRKAIASLVAVSWLSFAIDVRAQEPLLIQAALDPNTSVVESVKRDCALDTMVGDWVLESVSKKHPGSKKLQKGDSAGKGKVLKVTIVQVMGVGGGAYSGPKSMTVRADLVQGGKVLATTTKERASGGGAFGGMKGTCQIFGRVAKTLGADVASWLPSALKGN